MGVLTLAGAMNGDATPAREPEPINDLPERDDAPEAVEQAQPEAKGEFVPMSKIEPKKPGSRRSRAEEQIDARFRSYEEERKREREEYQQTLRQQAEQVARLTGQLEALQKMPMQTPVAAQNRPDPADLRRRAREALQEGRFDDYERLNTEAVELIAEQKAEARAEAIRKELQERIPQPVNPMIQFLLNQHPAVAMAGERGARAVMLKEQELDLYGVPPGPQRTQKAFELANQWLAGQQPTPPARYSQDTAASLAGVPTGRSGNGSAAGQESGVTLTPVQLEAARNAGMTPAEYARWMNPQKYGLVK